MGKQAEEQQKFGERVGPSVASDKLSGTALIFSVQTGCEGPVCRNESASRVEGD